MLYKIKCIHGAVGSAFGFGTGCLLETLFGNIRARKGLGNLRHLVSPLQCRSASGVQPRPLPVDQVPGGFRCLVSGPHSGNMPRSSSAFMDAGGTLERGVPCPRSRGWKPAVWMGLGLQRAVGGLLSALHPVVWGLPAPLTALCPRGSSLPWLGAHRDHMAFPLSKRSLIEQEPTLGGPSPASPWSIFALRLREDSRAFGITWEQQGHSEAQSPAPERRSGSRDPPHSPESGRSWRLREGRPPTHIPTARQRQVRI